MVFKGCLKHTLVTEPETLTRETTLDMRSKTGWTWLQDVGCSGMSHLAIGRAVMLPGPATCFTSAVGRMHLGKHVCMHAQMGVLGRWEVMPGAAHAASAARHHQTCASCTGFGSGGRHGALKQKACWL